MPKAVPSSRVWTNVSWDDVARLSLQLGSDQHPAGMHRAMTQLGTLIDTNAGGLQVPDEDARIWAFNVGCSVKQRKSQVMLEKSPSRSFSHDQSVS